MLCRQSCVQMWSFSAKKTAGEQQRYCLLSFVLHLVGIAYVKHASHCLALLLQCRALTRDPAAPQSGNSTIISVSAMSSQPCSSLQPWIDSSDHIVVIDNHSGCSKTLAETDQLILRLMPNGICSSQAQQQSLVQLQGQPVESFEAFAKLSLRLYRGPDSVPQAKVGKVSPDNSENDSGSEAEVSLKASVTAATPHLSSAANKQLIAHSNPLRALQDCLWRVAASLRYQFTSSSKIASRTGSGDSKALLQPVHLDSAPVTQYPNSTHGRHLLSGTSCIPD